MADRDFSAFVADLESRMSDGERTMLDGWRAYYRGEGPAPATAGVPAGMPPRPPWSPDSVALPSFQRPSEEDR